MPEKSNFVYLSLKSILPLSLKLLYLKPGCFYKCFIISTALQWSLPLFWVINLVSNKIIKTYLHYYPFFFFSTHWAYTWHTVRVPPHHFHYPYLPHRNPPCHTAPADSQESQEQLLARLQCSKSQLEFKGLLNPGRGCCS